MFVIFKEYTSDILRFLSLSQNFCKNIRRVFLRHKLVGTTCRFTLGWGFTLYFVLHRILRVVHFKSVQAGLNCQGGSGLGSSNDGESHD